MPKELENKISIVPCSCVGEKGAAVRCKICAGSGRVVEVDGVVCAWTEELSVGKIRIDDTEHALRLGVELFALVLVLLGAGSLGWLIYRAESASLFWTHLTTGSSLAVLPIWIGMLAGSYLMYRVQSEALESPNLEHAFIRSHELWRRTERSLDIAKYFSESSRYLVKHAYVLALRLKHEQARALHIFASLLLYPTVALLFSRLAVSERDLIERVKHLLAKGERGKTTKVSPEFYDALLSAFLGARERKRRQVLPTDIMVALAVSQFHDPIDILTDLDVNEQKVKHVAEWVELHRELVRRVRHTQGRAAYKPKGAMNRAYTSVATPVLDRLSRDLTAYARGGAFGVVVGREKELGEIFRIIQSGRHGVLLVGEEGIGKSALIGQLAQAMASEDVPKVLEDKRLVELSVPALVAGGVTLGGVENALLTLAREIRRAGNVILVVENVHTLVGIKSGGGETFDIAGVLAEALEQGRMHMIATTTPEEERALLQVSPLGRICERVPIAEADREQAISALEAKAPHLEGKLHVFYSYPALESLVDYSIRYVSEGHLPDKAIRLMEEAGVAVREERGERHVVTREDIAAVVSEKTNIPLTSITQKEGEMLLNLEALLHERIIDQAEAVTRVAHAIRRSRADVRERKRPIASFLFLGPTGVGKTEVARAVAALYFGEEKAMVRLDMSEYQGPDALDKLLGSAGANIHGYLTEAVRTRPFSLVLLDEFEKASGEVLNLFLQVLEDGRLTDAHGRTVNFSNTIIICTSNAGAETILTSLRTGQSIEQIKEKLIQDELPRRFRPELLNRFDGVVVFKPLSVEDVQAITRLILSRVEKELNEKGIGLKVEDVAVHDLVREGFDPVYGARPLRRLIQERVEDPIAEYILSGQLQRRDVVILEYGGRPRVEKAPPI